LGGAGGKAGDVAVHEEGIDDKQRRGAEQRSGLLEFPSGAAEFCRRGDPADGPFGFPP
jgi:hypothetical protein